MRLKSEIESEIEKCENKIWDVCCNCCCFNWCGKKENNRKFGGCMQICFGIIALIISTFFIYFF